MNKIIILFLLAFLPFTNSFSHEFINVKTIQTNGVAITLDACGGKADLNILNYLIQNNIPSTIFVTNLWLQKNNEAIHLMNQHHTLFSIQNHGLEHKEAVLENIGAYHLPTVKTVEGLNKEVESNKKMIQNYFPNNTAIQWYRTAGALYDQKSIHWLDEHKWKIAGYTIAADGGATFHKEQIFQNIKKAKSGDIILVHMNKPNSDIHEGFINGIKYLQEKNTSFVFLE